VVDRLRPEYASSIDFIVIGDLDADRAWSEYSYKQGVQAIPTMVVVDARGREVRRVVGGLDEAGLRELLGSAK
jgi:hypothetical protein